VPFVMTQKMARRANASLLRSEAEGHHADESASLPSFETPSLRSSFLRMRAT
jgi:hypothetical protein